MNSLVVLAMLLASLLGHEVLTSLAAGRLHSLTGSLALIGMFIHGVKHTSWMLAMVRRLGGEEKLVRSA